MPSRKHCCCDGGTVIIHCDDGTFETCFFPDATISKCLVVNVVGVGVAEGHTCTPVYPSSGCDCTFGNGNVYCQVYPGVSLCSAIAGGSKSCVDYDTCIFTCAFDGVNVEIGFDGITVQTGVWGNAMFPCSGSGFYGMYVGMPGDEDGELSDEIRDTVQLWLNTLCSGEEVQLPPISITGGGCDYSSAGVFISLINGVCPGYTPPVPPDPPSCVPLNSCEFWIVMHGNVKLFQNYVEDNGTGTVKTYHLRNFNRLFEAIYYPSDPPENCAGASYVAGDPSALMFYEILGTVEDFDNSGIVYSHTESTEDGGYQEWEIAYGQNVQVTCDNGQTHIAALTLCIQRFKQYDSDPAPIYQGNLSAVFALSLFDEYSETAAVACGTGYMQSLISYVNPEVDDPKVLVSGITTSGPLG